MDLGAIVRRSLVLYRRNFLPFALIALVGVPLRLAGSVTRYDFLAPSIHVERTVTQPAIVELLGWLGILVATLVAGAVVVGIADAESGTRLDPVRAYRIAVSGWGSLILAELRVVFSVALLVVTVIGIPFAVRQFVRWSFTIQAVLIEGTPGWQAPGESSRVVIGNWWRVAGTVLLWVVVGFVAEVVTARLALAVAPALVAALASGVVFAVMAPFFAGVWTLLYLDLRARKAGLPAAG